MNSFLELAERCEAATGPDRQLDLAILKARGGCHWDAWLIDDSARSSGPPGTPIPPFTASLDAAMTLAPEGWLLGTLFERNATSPNWRWKAELWNPEIERRVGERAAYVSGRALKAHVPALAFTAAALRAHAAKEERR